jgi:hypothetical protein
VSAATAIGTNGGSAWLRRANRALAALERDRVCWAVLGIAMVGYAVLAMWLTRGTTLFVDGVNLFLNNRGLDAGALLAPLNGHLVLMERSVYAGGFALFGAGSIVFRLVEVAGVLLAVGVLFELLKRRLGPAVALAPALLILFLGTAWEVTLVPDVMTNTYCVAAGLGSVLALDRRDRRGDVAACLLLVASICCWTLGVAFAIGAGVRIALESGRRRLWLVAVPLALYAAWWIWVRVDYVPAHGRVQAGSLSNALTIPGFIANEASSVAASLSGLGHDFISTDPLRVFVTDPAFGFPLAVLGVGAIIVIVRRRGASPSLWGALTALLAFWIALAVGFEAGRTPLTARYVYPGAVLALVIAAEATRGLRASARQLAVLYGFTALALGANIVQLGDGASYFRGYSAMQRAQFTAIEVAGTRGDPAFMTQNVLAHAAAGPYLAAVARNGSPAYTTAQLAAQHETVREAADEALVPALAIHLAPGRRAAAPGHCRILRRAPAGSTSVLTIGAPKTVLLRSRSAAPVALRRFGSTSTVGVGSLRPRRVTALRLPADGYAGPWYVSVGPAQAPVSACGAG